MPMTLKNLPGIGLDTIQPGAVLVGKLLGRGGCGAGHAGRAAAPFFGTTTFTAPGLGVVAALIMPMWPYLPCVCCTTKT